MEDTSTSTIKPSYFDVVISGGGLSGCLMALSLLSLKTQEGKPLSIAIIEAANTIKTTQTVNNINSVFDDRVLALSHASAEYLKILGAWEFIEEHAQAITDIHISDRGYYGKARIKAKAHNVKAVGYVIEMSQLGLALQRALESQLNKASTLSSNNIPQSHLTWFTPDSIKHIEWKSDSVELILSSDTKLSASLLIGCDGVNSICRTSANIACDKSDYGQSALITNVSTKKAHHGIAFERFTENGPIAMLPMVNVANESSRSSLVWTLTPEQANEIKLLTDDEFKTHLEQSFGSWLGGIEKVGKRHVYPLSLVKAQEQIHHRMVLIGNASHTIHPIAGQGFNLGLRDVQALANTIENLLNCHEDIGSFHQLTAYALSRKKDHRHIITLTDSLVTLFSNELFPLIVGRNIGLKVLNYLPAIKNTFVNKTMGY